jgi:hypothetical protein
MKERRGGEVVGYLSHLIIGNAKWKHPAIEIWKWPPHSS